MNGAWRNERKHVNHSEDYEVRYAKPRPTRTGYKGKRKFDDGGGISNKLTLYKSNYLSTENKQVLTSKNGKEVLANIEKQLSELAKA